jgi:enamine deaminase RidA (YjgF/YER057c/UK114 family)
MKMNKAINVGVAEKLGKYSDAIQINSGASWLYTSGTPGLNEDGTLPADFESQAQLAWKSIIAMLHAADMDVEHIVKINQSMLRREDLTAYRIIRDENLGLARPASMLSFISELVMPGMLIELEVVAAK